MEATLDSTTLEKEENGMKTIEKWERSVSISEEALRKVVREELYKVVRETRKIDDAQAELEIVSLMKRKIGEADKRINAFEIFLELGLPSEQIEKVLGKLENEGRISELDE